MTKSSDNYIVLACCLSSGDETSSMRQQPQEAFGKTITDFSC